MRWDIKMAGTWEKVPALSLAVESGQSLEEDETLVLYKIRLDLSRGGAIKKQAQRLAVPAVRPVLMTTIPSLPGNYNRRGTLPPRQEGKIQIYNK